jgi:hypothetical protein
MDRTKKFDVRNPQMYYTFSFDWDEEAEKYTSHSMLQLTQIKNKTVKTQPHKLVLDAISIHLAGHLKQHAEANGWGPKQNRCYTGDNVRVCHP